MRNDKYDLRLYWLEFYQNNRQWQQVIEYKPYFVTETKDPDFDQT